MRIIPIGFYYINFCFPKMCVFGSFPLVIRILFVETVQKRKVELEIKQKQEIISKYNSGTKSKELAAFIIPMLYQLVPLYQAHTARKALRFRRKQF